MNRWAEIATLHANPDEDGYKIVHEWGTQSCSKAGMDQLIQHATLMDRFQPALDAFRGLLHVWCEQHNRPLINEDGEPFFWGINDYAEWGDDSRSPMFMLWGRHQFSGEFCIPAWVRGTLDGSLIACDGDWRRR